MQIAWHTGNNQIIIEQVHKIININIPQVRYLVMLFWLDALCKGYREPAHSVRKLIIIDIRTGAVKSILKIDNEKISRPFVLDQNLFIIKDNSIIKLN